MCWKNILEDTILKLLWVIICLSFLSTKSCCFLWFHMKICHQFLSFAKKSTLRTDCQCSVECWFNRKDSKPWMVTDSPRSVYHRCQLTWIWKCDRWIVQSFARKLKHEIFSPSGWIEYLVIVRSYSSNMIEFNSRGMKGESLTYITSDLISNWICSKLLMYNKELLLYFCKLWRKNSTI